ncbi:flavin reductase family protein [Nocardioides marmoribigeumensis]|uniref:Flavin reductase (DIM6/NTAB) family NADH-FMN oxidoreductase RutF n=1 Tax=Nocardioides marmoribigeumensis TaxID=433649 RepID=A0ABU2BQ96_9ACTN|nr:flavin reductase family protein [Nocardioides marmoribigeumensis]MDR7360815.1 flavin reductase (DIM6/NTAB) family NADH-FMN oxidoreductase RutF [Nocardioides marmoribigeumensis]
MTIHTEHPFAEAEDPVRRFRGRLGGTVAVACAGSGADRAGLTVTSFVVANGDPAHLLVLVDPDSDLADAVEETGALAVSLLTWEHRDLAEAFAGLAPAPGGMFRLGTWEQTEWGPVLADGPGWAAGPVVARTEVGWSLQLDAEVARVVVRDGEALVHRRGRYQRPG